MIWKTDAIRYNVHRSLGAGGGRVGQFKTLEEARNFVGNQNLFIWKAYYHKGNDGKYRVFYEEEA